MDKIIKIIDANIKFILFVLIMFVLTLVSFMIAFYLIEQPNIKTSSYYHLLKE